MSSPVRIKPVPTTRLIPTQVEDAQVERVRRFKAGRSESRVREALHGVKRAAQEGENLMPPLIAAVDVGCTVGEISDLYREVFGEYRDPAYL